TSDRPGLKAGPSARWLTGASISHRCGLPGGPRFPANRRGPPWASPRRPVPPEKTDPSGGAPGLVGKPGRTQTLQGDGDGVGRIFREPVNGLTHAVGALFSAAALVRSEEHTSELQSRENL